MEAPTLGARPRDRAEEPIPMNAGLSDRVRSLRLPERASRTGSTAKLAWTMVALLGVVCAFLGYREFTRGGMSLEIASTDLAPTGESTESSFAVNADASASPPISAAPAPQAGAIALESKGYLIPAHQILVSPKVSGMILKLFVIEGARVEKGDILAELEKNDYEADLKRAKATLSLAMARRDLMVAGSRTEEREQAEAELAEAERQLVQLKTEFQRYEALRSKDKSLVSDSTFDEQKSLYEAAQFRIKRVRFRRDQILNGNRKEEIAAAEAECAQAEADVEKAAWKVNNCTIRAPISGTVLKKNAEEGNIVNTIAPNGSFSLCDLADLADLEVDLSIQERDISKVYPRQKCRIRSDAYPDRQYEGVVDRLLPIADRAKGAVPVRVKVKVPKAEEGIYLKPDMSAIVTFYNTTLEAENHQSSPKSSAGAE